MKSAMSAAALGCALALVPLQAAQGQATQAQAEIEEVVVIGSRFATARSASDAAAPVDVFSSEDIGRVGNHADLTDSLRALAPSYNAPTASGDGDTFVRSTSLRGLAPDQTLVMINGKRRHRAALIAEFVPAAGKGAHGPNIGLIPTIAVERVEVLRDGAVAQYGADAIAGVINLRMKEAAEGGEVRVDYGEHHDERGRIRGVDGNAPTKLLGSTVFVDAELRFDVSEAMRLALGGTNVFDEYIDVIGPPYANRLNVGLPYARRTAANFEGGSWYLRGSYHW